MCSCQQKWLDQICWCDQQKKVGSTRNTSAKASVEPSCIIFHFSIFCYICCLKRNPVTLHLSCLLAQCLCFSGPCSIFAVTVSSRVRGGSQETLCALIQGPTELVSLSITLDTDTGSAVILEKAAKQDFYQCLNFQVPAVRTNTVATINVTVKGESATMNKKTKILIVPPAFIHIIQTDKPIYKPGQTGKYRHNQNINITLAQSDTYTFRNCDDCQYSVCLCSEQSRTFTWIVTPTALGKIDLKVSAEAVKTSVLCGNEVASVPDVGRIDTMVRSLLVEVRTPQSVSHNALLCPAGTVLKLVQMFVAASARATVSVLGDLMGRAIKNLDQLLAMPYGCGEQNMLLFAPNIFILNYLKSTDQLTAEILDKATHFLESGYQRELTYKHDDGSYSAFGKSDASGNTWLTSFVMKSFGGARPYIFVDPKHILDAKKWLYSKQGSDGCIRSVGKLFHNGMKVMTAMIGSLIFLRESAGQMDNLYTTALMSYTFTLARDEEMRVKLITYLHQQSRGTRHWHREGVSGTGVDSLEVEITSYVLLALLSGPALPDFGLDYSSSIVRWLTQQQNPYGGFSSTQDTVVALQALAKYGAATYSVGGKTTVTVTSLGGLNKEFIVDQSNRLLYQEEKLSDVPGEYTIKAEGQSCVLAQVRFTEKPFCFYSYQGRREETNMVIINVKLLSGHILDKGSLESVNSDFFFFYLQISVDICLCLQLKKGETVVYSMTLEQDVPVRNLKAAVVKVYDYYQTIKARETSYVSVRKIILGG
uniref:Alpha-2-macroglobulin-like protein 1 n=1 Tax=Hippocampus comes TaxID=109280 RepID=A0A3Q2Y1S1_HIPCM